MLKFLQKSLPVLAIAGAGITANAQLDTLFKENFQGFTSQGYPVGEICTYAPPATPPATGGNQYNTLEPLEGTFSQQMTYSRLAEPVTYTFVNAGANPTCPVRGGTRVNPITVGSNGFAELTRVTENPTSNVPGSLTLSKIPNRITYLTVRASYTGGSRSCAVLKSLNEGTTWDTVSTYADLLGDTYGIEYTFEINASDVQLRFSSYPDAARSQRSKIHDIIALTDEPSSLSGNVFFADGAKIMTSDNTISIFAPSSAQVEILSLNGTILAKKNILAGTEESVALSKGGLYLVRYVSANRVMTKKIIVE